VSNQTGTTVVELLVASGIMLAASAAVFTLTNEAIRRSPHWNDVADLHQRARVAVDAVTRAVSVAGAAVPNGALAPAFPAIEPRRRSTFAVSSSAVTLRHVPEGGAWTTLASDLAPDGTTVEVATHPGCAVGAVACGLDVGMTVAVGDGAGGWHLLGIEAVAPPILTIADRVPGRTATFAGGSTIAEVLETSLYFDRGAGVLRQEGPGDGDFPIVDNVADARFEYFGAGLARIDLAALVDGPLCGTGALAYDCDLHRIRSVRAVVTLAPARAPIRPLTVVVDVSPRNVQR
jgi:hypothetical protein